MAASRSACFSFAAAPRWNIGVCLFTFLDRVVPILDKAAMYCPCNFSELNAPPLHLSSSITFVSHEIANPQCGSSPQENLCRTSKLQWYCVAAQLSTHRAAGTGTTTAHIDGWSESVLNYIRVMEQTNRGNEIALGSRKSSALLMDLRITVDFAKAVKFESAAHLFFFSTSLPQQRLPFRCTYAVYYLALCRKAGNWLRIRDSVLR